MRNLRNALSLLLALFMVTSLSAQVLADNYIGEIEIATPIINCDIENAYVKYVNYSELNNSDFMSEEDFVNAFQCSMYSDVSLFLESLIKGISPNAFTISEEIDADINSSGNAWYFDTGKKLPRAAQYSSYNLLSLVKKGDIIYETTGNLASIAGHAAIVEGVFWSSEKNQFYIRVIEAISNGVRRGVWDEQRLADKSGTILRVTSANDSQRNQAVDFCISQLGKSYSLHTPKHSAATSESWYCSELVWAAYKNQAIELHNTPTAGEVFPADLYASNKTSIISYSSKKPSSYFTDTSNHWAKSSINYLVNNGIMTGINTYTFSPDVNITRLSFVFSIYKLSGCPSASATHYFSDTSSLSYAELMAIRWAATANIVEGYSDGNFKPNDSLTREQLSTFLYRYASYIGVSTTYNTNALSGFSDAGSVSSYALAAMKWAVTKGIISGTDSGTLSPSATCTRAQSATMLNRFINNCM